MATSITSITNLQNLPNLTKFEVVDSNLQTVDFSNLSNLSDITVIRNQLETLNITNCTTLTTLDVAENNITTLTDIVGLDEVQSLSIISIDTNSVSGIVDFTSFPQLTRIQAGNNSITEIIIDSTQSLNLVDAYQNQLTETAVDNILVELSTNGVNGGSCYLDDVGNAIPSATGLAAKTILEGNGWTVSVNT